MYFDIKNHKENYSDFLVGYVGYELSFGSKWFAGYVKKDDVKYRGDLYSYKHCMNQAPNLKGIDFYCCSFEDYKNMEGCTIYCDPPYSQSTKYKQKEFDYDSFYAWCRKQSEKNIVLVSEYNMPDDFECIWQKGITVTLDSNREKMTERTKGQRNYSYAKGGVINDDNYKKYFWMATSNHWFSGCCISFLCNYCFV